MANWDSVVVEEESESGDVIKSTIRIPATTTRHTQRMLFRICRKITQAGGGHSASRRTLRDLSGHCFAAVLRTYSRARVTNSTDDGSLHGQSTGKNPTQPWALQVWNFLFIL